MEDTSGEILSSLTSSVEDEENDDDIPRPPSETPPAHVEEIKEEIPTTLLKVDWIGPNEFDEKNAVINRTS